MRFPRHAQFPARLKRCFLVIVAVTIMASGTLAQWRTESFDLVEGWQAIYLRVDTELATIGTILEDYPQIEEVWRWRPSGLDQVILNFMNKS